jgi:hypothetical protein
VRIPITVELLRDGADWYARSNDLPVSEVDYARVVADPMLGKHMGSLYLAAPDFDQTAVPAYEAFRAETSDQFAFLTLPIEWGGLGVEVEVCRDDPYRSATALVRDIEEHGRLKVWATSQCGNPHPFLSNEENDMFRAVHDAFGHAATGRGFNPDGEEAAWCKHSQMYSLLARRAMTTETRGQNSVLVFHGDGRTFPKQKVCLLPPEFSDLRSVSYAPITEGSGSR